MTGKVPPAIDGGTAAFGVVPTLVAYNYLTNNISGSGGDSGAKCEETYESEEKYAN